MTAPAETSPQIQIEHRIVRTTFRAKAGLHQGSAGTILGGKSCSRACWISRPATVDTQLARAGFRALLDATHLHRPAATANALSTDFSLRLPTFALSSSLRAPPHRQERASSPPYRPRYFALIKGVAQLGAIPPCSIAPSVRFLHIGSMLVLRARPPSRRCAWLRLLQSNHNGTCTAH